MDGDHRMPRFLLALSTLLLAVACESTPNTSSAITLASAQYEAGNFDRARAAAEPLLAHGRSHTDEAAWIVGLCDYRQGKLNAARKQFRFVTSGTDKALAAQARVMLAQIDLADGHASLCLASLARAWPDLPEPHRRLAAELAITAAQSLDDTQAEDRWLARMPAAPSRTTPEISALRDRYTLQAGAYRSRSGAEQLQTALNGQDTPLGEATIRTRTDRRGQTLFLVQIGSFTTRSAADAARGHVSGTDLVVVAQ